MRCQLHPFQLWADWVLDTWCKGPHFAEYRVICVCVSYVWRHYHIILDVIKYCDHPRWYEKIPPGGGTSNWRWHLWLEVRSPIGGDTSNWRWDLWLEVRSPIGGPTSNWEAPMLHVGNQLFFRKKRDYLLLITSSHHLSTRWNVNLL